MQLGIGARSGAAKSLYRYLCLLRATLFAWRESAAWLVVFVGSFFSALRLARPRFVVPSALILGEAWPVL